MKKIISITYLIFLLLIGSYQVNAAEKIDLIKIDWSFNGLFGKFDRGSLQRGYQVYSEVCAACHSMKYLSYRNLSEKGGPEFSIEQAKAIAASFEITDGPNADGEMFTRPGKLSDNLPGRVNISPSELGPSLTSKDAAIAFACSKENSGPPFSAKFL